MVNDLDQVSVVIPVLNDRSNLEVLLRSLTPFQELEIVVVDGGSNEGSIHEPQQAVRLLRLNVGELSSSVQVLHRHSDLGSGFCMRIAW